MKQRKANVRLIARAPELLARVTDLESTRDELARKLVKAESYLSAIAHGKGNDAQYNAAMYWGGYEQMDAALSNAGKEG